MIDYDVVIVGGAMTGATLALALSAQSGGGMRIAVIEKQPPQRHSQSGFDARCIALSDGSCRKLAQIGLPEGGNLWQRIQPACTPIRQVRVSDKGHGGMLEFSAAEFRLAQLGVVAELSRLGGILLQSVEQYTNIDYYCPMEIGRIECGPQNVKIRLKNDRTLTALLVVGADGSHSPVASAVNIEREILCEYGQSAVITNVKPQQPHQNRAFERFTEEGPLALLPMAENLMSLVWCVKNADELMTLDENAFLTRLQQTFGWRLGRFLQCGKRFTYPLKLSRARRHVQPRAALIGNASQTLHPVAGQGFNLAVRDVTALAGILSSAYLRRQDLGDYVLLRQYERSRRTDQNNLIRLTDGLVTLFANSVLPLQIGRNLGLMTLAQSSLLRQSFAKPALGWT